MKMMYVLVCASMVSMTCQAQRSDVAEKTSEEQSTFGDLGGFFREFDTLFDDMYGWAGDVARRAETFFSCFNAACIYSRCFEKDKGDLIAQYQSPSFEGATDFLVNEKQKSIVVLTPSAVYRIPTTHLN